MFVYETFVNEQLLTCPFTKPVYEQPGGVFKGLELGLVDFPACVGGEDVYLCWQYGEKEIAFYHKRDEGFADRRPIGTRVRKPQYEQ